jgi:hypothetical protein
MKVYEPGQSLFQKIHGPLSPKVIGGVRVDGHQSYKTQGTFLPRITISPVSKSKMDYKEQFQTLMLTEKTSYKNNGGRGWIVFLILLVALLVVMYYIFRYIKKNENPDEESTEDQ